MEEILSKCFIDRHEFKTLVGLPTKRGDALYNQIKAKIEKDLEKDNLRLPDSRHLPLDLTLGYLSKFGITYSHNK